MGRIGTHNGVFHCDEVLACFFLKSLPEFRNHDVLRTRDPELLATCDVVVDVGGEFDHTKRHYDHHQRGFTDTMKSLGLLDFDTKLSSAGLIYAHYGRNVIAALLGLSVDDPALEVLYKKVYETFVEAVDAVDNGIPQCDCTPRYRLGGTLSGRVGHLNPAWNEEDVDVDGRFSKAMELVGKEFRDALGYCYKSWLPAKNIVADAIKDRLQADASGKIFILSKGSVPWKEHFFTLEKELQAEALTYVVFADTTSGNWRVQAIPNSEKTPFENRLPLPAAWRGLRDEGLSKVAGIPDCVFVHGSGFIGGNKTQEGAVEMARRSLQIAANDN